MSSTAVMNELGMPVEVGEIDKALHKLWEADEASTNASLMNLLVYSENANDLTKNSESIRELTREHACRAVLIAMDRANPEASVKSWITAHCHLAHGKKSVCCEQISFLLTGKATGRLRNTVFAHLNSDLPLVFWWQGEFSDLFDERLYRMLDRLIVDSATWEDASAGFAKVNQVLEETDGKLVVQDLAWTRSFHYRVALARLFDDPSAMRSAGQIHQVKIVAHRAQATTAKLLLSWMAVKAGWRSGLELGLGSNRDLEKGESFLFETEEGVSVEALIEWDDEGAPLSLLEVKAPDLTISVSREKGSKHLCQSLKDGGHQIDCSGPADEDEPAKLLEDQLSRGGKNSLYLKALSGLGQLSQ